MTKSPLDRLALPGVSVVAPYYSHPYTSGMGPKAGPNGRVRTVHYQAPPDYVSDMAMHPYTSGVGAKAGPNRVLRFEHFQVTPDYVADVSMHPYTSGVGVAPLIPPGMRAISVRVNDVVGVAGFILPGMRVDVLVTGHSGGREDTMTATVLQNITVLSAGQTIQADAGTFTAPAEGLALAHGVIYFFEPFFALLGFSSL